MSERTNIDLMPGGLYAWVSPAEQTEQIPVSGLDAEFEEPVESGVIAYRREPEDAPVKWLAGSLCLAAAGLGTLGVARLLKSAGAPESVTNTMEKIGKGSFIAGAAIGAVSSKGVADYVYNGSDRF